MKSSKKNEETIKAQEPVVKKVNIKFTFYLKNGNTVVNEGEMQEEVAGTIISAIQNSFRDSANGYIALDGLTVRLADCSAVEWEILE